VIRATVGQGRSVMSIMVYVAGFLFLGLLAGILSGLLGIGGGILIVPALVFIVGLTQHQAQGTTLALMVPPIGLLAAWTYYKQGNVDLKIAGLICLGFFFGGLLGAKFATAINAALLKKLFGAALLITALKMILAK
jgi:uncharacterized membrane protein YfcA